MFGNPTPGERPFPELVASGDLDGDLHFICWNETILRQIRPEPSTDKERFLSAEDPKEKMERPYYPHWFGKAQQLMMDAAAHKDLSKLMGCLYRTLYLGL
jgi:hypothetical protein